MISAIFEEMALMSIHEWERINQFYSAYLNGRTIETSHMWPGMLPLYVVMGEVATINIQGVITRTIDPFIGSLGATSTEEIKRHIISALRTEGINRLVLNINSPGGTVSGVGSLARLIFQLRELFPIDAITDGKMLSAGYWIGSAARSVLISCDAVSVGSIGIIAYRKRSEDPTLVKGLHGEHKGQIKEEDIKDSCEHLYRAFAKDISLFRGIPVEDVFAMQGLTFTGNNAIKAGLADGHYDSLIWTLDNKLIKKETL